MEGTNDAVDRSVPFKLYFSNLVKCSIPANFFCHRQTATFVVEDSRGFDMNESVVNLVIRERERGFYAIVDAPAINVRIGGKMKRRSTIAVPKSRRFCAS